MSSRRLSFANPDGDSDFTVETVRDIVKRAEVKLSALQAHRTFLRKRLRALHHLANTFAANGRSAALGFSRRNGSPETEQRSTSSELAPSQPSKASLNMRRACRIALMETEHATAEEILNRICNRGSMLLPGSADGLAVVTAELNQMLRDGEAAVLGSGTAECWKLNRRDGA